MSTALVDSAGVTNPLVLLQSAIDRGTDADTLSKLTDLAERWQANLARQRFGEALARFQADCPPVSKSRSVMNKGGQTVRYKFAGFEDVWGVAAPHLKDHGISVSFSKPEQTSGAELIVCRLQVGSHAEDRPFCCPKMELEGIAKAMFLTAPQAYGLVLSYLKRYALCAALGIVVADEDNGGAAADALDTVIASEVEQIEALIQETKTDRVKFLAYAEVEDVWQINRRQVGKLIGFLKQKKAKQNGAKPAPVA